MTTISSPPVDVKLSDLLNDGLFVDGDWVESKDQDPDGEVRLIQLADVGDGVFRDRSSRFLTYETAGQLGCTFLEPGDVLVARMPEPLGRACIFPDVGQPAITAVDVCILRPNSKRVRPEWLMSAINSPDFRAAMQQFVRGTTRQRISRKNLGMLSLRVPDVSEQIAITSAIEQLESNRTDACEHVANARRAVERFRQAVLAAACSGRLTAGWRREHGFVDDPEDELPGGWSRQTLDELGEWRTGGTPSRKHPEYFGGSIPWVKSGDLRDRAVRSTQEQVTPEALDNSSAKLMPVGTVAIALYGATIGRLGVLEIDAATNQACANCVLDEAKADRWFLFYFLLSQRSKLIAAGQGGAQPNLTNRIVREWPIALPPLTEQLEIVSCAEAILDLSANLERRIDAASRHVERTPRTVLAKACRGDLVPAGEAG